MCPARRCGATSPTGSRRSSRARARPRWKRSCRRPTCRDNRARVETDLWTAFHSHFNIESFCYRPGVEGAPLTARGATRRPASGQPRKAKQPVGAGPEDRSLSPEQVVRHPARAGNDLQVEPVQQLIGGLPEPYSGTELHRRDRHMHGVDEVGVEKLSDGGAPAAEPDVLALRRLPGLLQDRGRVAVDEVEGGVGKRERRTLVVGQDEYRGTERGSSPHQPCHSWSCQGPRWGPNLLRPMISAPMLRA